MTGGVMELKVAAVHHGHFDVVDSSIGSGQAGEVKMWWI